MRAPGAGAFHHHRHRNRGSRAQILERQRERLTDSPVDEQLIARRVDVGDVEMDEHVVHSDRRDGMAQRLERHARVAQGQSDFLAGELWTARDRHRGHPSPLRQGGQGRQRYAGGDFSPRRCVVTEQSQDLVPQRIVRRSRPSPVNVLTGVAGLGARAGVGVVGIAAASVRPAARPAIALVRIGWNSAAGDRVRPAIGRALWALDAAGGTDRQRARAAASRTVDAMLDRVAVRLVTAGLVERVTAELIAADVPERVAEQIAESQVMEAIFERLIASNTLDRLAVTMLESRLYDDVVDRVLASEELWRIVDQIAQSPEVMNAITAGSVGLAGEVADQVRRRTVVADDVAERIARRLLRRSPRERGGDESTDAS